MAENPDAIRREIEETREEMAETIDALEYKADVRSRAKDRVTDVRESVAERADGVLSSLRGTAQRVGATMRGDMTETSGGVRETTDEMTDRARSGMEQGRRVAEDNPLLLALGAVAAGFLLGMALPGTRMENERIGSTADEMKSQAMQRGSEMIERAGDRAEEAVERTTAEASAKMDEMREPAPATRPTGTSRPLPPTGTYDSGA